MGHPADFHTELQNRAVSLKGFTRSVNPCVLFLAFVEVWATGIGRDCSADDCIVDKTFNVKSSKMNAPRHLRKNFSGSLSKSDSFNLFLTLKKNETALYTRSH